VDYDYAYQGSGTVDICIIRESDAQAWQGAQSGGWACHAAVNSASGSATIAAGVYYLAFLCDNTFVDCKVAFSASATD
jgi:hypothetical protein